MSSLVFLLSMSILKNFQLLFLFLLLSKKKEKNINMLSTVHFLSNLDNKYLSLYDCIMKYIKVTIGKH